MTIIERAADAGVLAQKLRHDSPWQFQRRPSAIDRDELAAALDSLNDNEIILLNWAYRPTYWSSPYLESAFAEPPPDNPLVSPLARKLRVIAEKCPELARDVRAFDQALLEGRGTRWWREFATPHFYKVSSEFECKGCLITGTGPGCLITGTITGTGQFDLGAIE